jgi:hypothetical protein
MSNDLKNERGNERHSAGENDADRSHGTSHQGQSQDASRHQQDAAHHKGYKSPQQGAPDGQVDQHSRGGPGSDPSDQKNANGPGHGPKSDP